MLFSILTLKDMVTDALFDVGIRTYVVNQEVYWQKQ